MLPGFGGMPEPGRSSRRAWCRAGRRQNPGYVGSGTGLEQCCCSRPDSPHRVANLMESSLAPCARVTPNSWRRGG